MREYMKKRNIKRGLQRGAERIVRQDMACVSQQEHEAFLKILAAGKEKMEMYDVLIIGAGVVGSSIARELTRYDLKIGVLEREEDVCSGTSKANSGIVHAGFDAAPGSLKAKLNVEGNRMMPELSEELDFSFQQNGSIVLCFDENDLGKLEELYQKGVENGVEGLRIVRGEEMYEIEPEISDQVVAFLYAPTGGIVCPFGLTIAMAENACVNGAEFMLETEVKNIVPVFEDEKKGNTAETCVENSHKVIGYRIETSRGDFETKCVVNAAGVYSDVFHNMVSERKIEMIPRRGQYCLLDKKAGKLVNHTVFQLPTAFGKGVLVTPTVHGNLMLGPTAEDLQDKEDTITTADGLADVLEKAALSVKRIPRNMTITSFSGLRAHEKQNDFVLGEVEDAPGFFDAAGVESPGLTSAPAIGKMLAEEISQKLGAEKNPNFVGKRTGIVKLSELSIEEQNQKIKENPAYGTIVCRCESVTEGEIMDAIHRPLGARSLDGVKRRTRAGMGRCQAGFCTPKTMEILERELGKDAFEVSKKGCGSELLTGFPKE